MLFNFAILLTRLFYHASSPFLNYWLMFFNLWSYYTNSYCRTWMPIEISSKEVKAEFEIHPVTTEAKISKCPI